LSANYPTTLAAVEYHIGDEYDTSWGEDRAGFYRNQGTPDAWFDGVLDCLGGDPDESAQYNWYLEQYNKRHALPTDVTITITGMQVNGPSFTIRARVALEAGGTTKNMRVYVVQVLDHDPAYPNYCHNTFKQAAETEYVALTPGQSQVIQRDFTFDANSWAHSSDIRIVVWAQRNYSIAPAEVFQAAVMSWPFAPDCNGNGISDVQDIAAGTLTDANGNGVPDTCEIVPAITAQPSSHTACLGGATSFGIVAAGYPPPTFQWRRGVTDLVNDGRISGATAATLTINQVNSQDAAPDYNCVVTNLLGSATSDNAALVTESVSAAITAQPSNQGVCVNGAAHFSRAGLPGPDLPVAPR
jgi:hypothetical protein